MVQKSQTITWDGAKNLLNSGINHTYELVSQISSIDSMNSTWT